MLLLKYSGYGGYDTRVADPNHFNADLDPPFHFNADPDPAFHFDADPNLDQAPLSSDVNL